MRIPFVPRPDVLDPIAVVGLGRVAGALARRLLQLEDEPLHGLRGAAGDDLVVVLGAVEALPWVDGVNYLGRDPSAPRLLLPTMLRPAVAADVFERAVARHAAALPSPWAVLPHARRIFSGVHAGPIDRDLLGRWSEAHP
jgi:MoxR-vWA-beta-propeller ternary system domain bpX5